MRRSIASRCRTKTLLLSVLCFIIIVLMKKKRKTSDILFIVSPQHNAQHIKYMANNKKPTAGNTVKIGLLNITIAQNIYNTSVEDLTELYEETRGLYMDGVDYFLIINDGRVVLTDIILKSLIKELKFSSDVGLSISTENGINIMFHRSHLDMFGNIFPKKSVQSQTAFNWLFSIYENRIYFHSKKQSNGILIKVVNESEAEIIKEDRDLLEKYIKVVKEANHISPNGTKVIAMSLYGSDPKYTQGAIRNAQLARIHFPDWVLRFYVPPQNESKKYVFPEKVLQKLTSLQAEVKCVSHELSSVIPPMMLRFLVADDPDVDIFLVQDCDSRLGERISISVAFWLNSSNAPFYCMRDHPSHSNYAISGGLWGARRKAFMKTLNNTFTHFLKQGFKDIYLQDMTFLNKHIWPLVKSSAFCYDSCSHTKFPGSHPFPIARHGLEHAGQVFDQFDIGRQSSMNILKKALLYGRCIP